MFRNLNLVLLLLLAGSLVPKFHFRLTKKSLREVREIVQFGRWRDSFSSALCLYSDRDARSANDSTPLDGPYNNNRRRFEMKSQVLL